MIVFPNAKVNLGLSILQKRGDGYHDIRTVMVPVDWCDVLEVLDSQPLIDDSSGVVYRDSRLSFIQTGDLIHGNPADNLCVKAAQLFLGTFPSSRHFHIHLHKVIPSGAGLGGGSSDAAFLLRALNSLQGEPASLPQLKTMALALGSDCPFFIDNKPAIATGRGEILDSCDVALASYKVVIIKPDVVISTPSAYKSVVQFSDGSGTDNVLALPPEQWQGNVINDFEVWASNCHPEVGEMISFLKKKGAVYAAMSGSGSAVFGIFHKNASDPDLTDIPYRFWSGDFVLPDRG